MMVTAQSGMCIATVIALAGLLAQAQTADLPVHSAVKPAAVVYLYPEQVTVPAGKATTVTLHFRIAPGLHINSHTPSEEELIPTTLSIPEDSGVRLEGAVYPPGTEFTLPLAPQTKLSVYSGEFTIQARIVATAGDHLVESRLRYQACDNHACMPPKAMTAAFDVLAK
jgi:DsbC/DsbD-like thiol-disulfide interchange protein